VPAPRLAPPPLARYTAAMNITVNGEAREVEGGATVASLLDALGLAGRPVAVERNMNIVPRAKHGETALAAGDTLEIVTLVGGG